jgi:hypothetical protein
MTSKETFSVLLMPSSNFSMRRPHHRKRYPLILLVRDKRGEMRLLSRPYQDYRRLFSACRRLPDPGADHPLHLSDPRYRPAVLRYCRRLFSWSCLFIWNSLSRVARSVPRVVISKRRWQRLQAHPRLGYDPAMSNGLIVCMIYQAVLWG